MPLLRIVFRNEGGGTVVDLTDSAGTMTTHQLRGDIVFESLLHDREQDLPGIARAYSTNSRGLRTQGIARPPDPTECELVLLALTQDLGRLHVSRDSIMSVPQDAEVQLTVTAMGIEVGSSKAPTPRAAHVIQQRARARKRIIAV